jgi:DNA-binding MarR family transcriptional regulator
LDSKREEAVAMMHALRQFHHAMKFHKFFDGLKPPEVGILHHLACARKSEPSGVKVTDLGKALHVTTPSITQLVTQLERDGRVIRRMDGQDRRAVRVMMTDEGARCLEIAEERMVLQLQGLGEAMGQEKTKQLCTLLIEATAYLRDMNQNDTIEDPNTSVKGMTTC